MIQEETAQRRCCDSPDKLSCPCLPGTGFHGQNRCLTGAPSWLVVGEVGALPISHGHHWAPHRYAYVQSLFRRFKESGPPVASLLSILTMYYAPEAAHLQQSQDASWLSTIVIHLLGRSNHHHCPSSGRMRGSSPLNLDCCFTQGGCTFTADTRRMYSFQVLLDTCAGQICPWTAMPTSLVGACICLEGGQCRKHNALSNI